MLHNKLGLSRVFCGGSSFGLDLEGVSVPTKDRSEHLPGLTSGLVLQLLGEGEEGMSSHLRLFFSWLYHKGQVFPPCCLIENLFSKFCECF